ncbi:MAG: alpha-ketoglutarate-dependent dioxygenase AlkB [Acidimicrobiales bacterium]
MLVTVLQGTLFSAGEEVVLRELESCSERLTLGRGAWVELRPAWVGGAEVLFDQLVRDVPWRAERRQMYERTVDVPRLQHFYDEDALLPHTALAEMREALARRYAEELGEPFRTVGLCLYRDGRDSVAWHGDTIGRASREDTIVAIVSLGGARRFLLRPRGGGEARRFVLCAGDLLVMGGSCQRTWEHAVPKSSRPVAPRVSVQFRPRGVR